MGLSQRNEATHPRYLCSRVGMMVGVAGLVCVIILQFVAAGAGEVYPKADGYRGIWYSNQPSGDRYRYKYSGGLGTYCAKHLPLAFYVPEVNKTFFVYGGTKGVGEKNALLEMVAYYDHESGMVPKPTIVLEKGTGDAHNNPTITVDKNGYIWIFMSAHGGKDGFIYKSRSPYSIDVFERIEQHEFTYPQPWYVKSFGFMFLFTKYTRGRELYWRSSHDGIKWSDDQKIAGFGGHYQISWQYKNKRGTAFNYHPPKGGLNARTNLYYLETADFGQTWRTVHGNSINIPLESVLNDALVRDYQADGLLVYMKDLDFDREGNPVILYILSKGYESGPKNGPRIWTTAHWTGDLWEIHPVATSDHNYDMGSLYIEDDGTWRVIGPTEPGPQEYCTGGEVAMWTSKDRGETWNKIRQLTHNSARNHTYVRRPVKAHPGFYAFWADGDALQPSESHLYFTNKIGDTVWVLPDVMAEDFEKPRVYGAER